MGFMAMNFSYLSEAFFIPDAQICMLDLLAWARVKMGKRELPRPPRKKTYIYL